MVEQKPAPRTPGTGRPVRVLLVDDSEEVRAALSRWFALSIDFDWTVALPGPDGLEDALIKLEPDVALIDWDLPGVNPSELLTRLVPAYPGTVFAVLSAHVEP